MGVAIYKWALWDRALAHFSLLFCCIQNALYIYILGPTLIRNLAVPLHILVRRYLDTETASRAQTALTNIYVSCILQQLCVSFDEIFLES